MLSGYPINIMFTNQYYIRLVNDTVNNGTLISQNLTNAVALDFHWDFGVRIMVLYIMKFYN